MHKNRRIITGNDYDDLTKKVQFDKNSWNASEPENYHMRSLAILTKSLLRGYFQTVHTAELMLLYSYCL